jgi:hypothetical protein
VLERVIWVIDFIVYPSALIVGLLKYALIQIKRIRRYYGWVFSFNQLVSSKLVRNNAQAVGAYRGSWVSDKELDV